MSRCARWWVFLRDRFGAGSALMAAAFFAGNALLAARLTGATPDVTAWVAGSAATVLVFLRLRIFDDLKDAACDRRAHPDRPLASGAVSSREAKRAAIVVAAVELAAVAAVGPSAIVAWTGVLAYSLLMLREFFIGPWLRPRMELYAFAHTLVAAWIGLLCAAVATARHPWELPAPVLLAAVLNWATFNVFELARKSRAPEEEDPRSPSYSARLRPSGAAALALSQALLACAAAAWILGARGAAAAGVLGAGAAIVAGVYAWRPSRARLYRAGMTAFQAAIYALLALAPAARGGTT